MPYLNSSSEAAARGESQFQAKESDDHQPQPTSDIARRRRHGPAFLLREHGGFLIAAAIDKYVYINIHRRFVDGYLLKYSQMEEASSIDEIKHPIIREALR